MLKLSTQVFVLFISSFHNTLRFSNCRLIFVVSSLENIFDSYYTMKSASRLSCVNARGIMGNAFVISGLAGTKKWRELMLDG